VGVLQLSHFGTTRYAVLVQVDPRSGAAMYAKAALSSRRASVHCRAQIACALRNFIAALNWHEYCHVDQGYGRWGPRNNNVTRRTE